MSRVQNRTAGWVAATAGVCLLLLVATWFVIVSPRRAEAADLRSQDVAAQESNELLRLRIEELRVQYGKLSDTRAKLAEVHRQLPSSAELPAFVRSVDALASSSGVTLVSVVPGVAEAVLASPPSGQAATGKGSTATGLVAVPMSVVVSGDYFETVAFLRLLQTGMPRAFLVTALQLGQTESAGAGGEVKVTIAGKLFTMTEAATTATAKAPASSTATSSPSSTATVSPTSTATTSPSSTATSASGAAPTGSADTAALAAPAAASGDARW